MLTKLQTLALLYHQLGLRWLTFRLAYAFRLRTGLIRLQMPIYKWADRPLATWLKRNVPSQPEAYANWRKQNSPKFFSVGAGFPRTVARPPIVEAERILNGEIKYFAHEFQKTGFPPDWHKDPVSGIELNSTKHWSQISDEGEVDIKFIWEASRFSMVYPLARAYAFNHDERYAEAFWKLVESWAESNPPNAGPNWMDGQEAALHLMAWTFGLYAFMDSPATTPSRMANLTTFIAAHAQRIYSNTDFAIFTRGNHSISEALGLWMTGLLFPELKDAEKYLAFGRMSLEREAARQIFPDGSYSMYSLNYHRFILHLYLYAIRLGELNNSPFSTHLISSLSNSINYLSQFIDPHTGQMPVYGSNDGALVLPLNNCDFTDYRPLLQLGSVIINGQRMFEAGEWDEDVFWLCGEEFTEKKEEREKKRSDSFPEGGTYTLRGANSKAIIRCTNFQERPSHADQLHVDLWMGGQNIACDAGTYLYSGEGIWRNGLAHTSAHNTVTVDSKDQMKMVSRFTWVNWAQGRVIKQGSDLWQGEHDGYKPTHKRTVMALDSDRWLVVDHLDANEPHHYSLHWLLDDAPFEENKNSIHLKYESSTFKIQTGITQGQEKFSIVRADPNSTRGWRSKYYGHKEPAISAILETDQSQTVFWTFFGFEADQVELMGNLLRVNYLEINLKTMDGRQ